MSIVNAMTGAATDSGFRVKGTTDSSPGGARLAVADNLGLSGPEYFTATVDGNLLSCEATGIDPATQYYWAWELDGALDTGVTGRSRTFPTEDDPASFTFTCTSCGGLNPQYPAHTGPAPNRVSNHPVADDIRLAAPLFHIQDGDLHYGDIGSGKHGLTNPDIDTIRAMYDSVLATGQGRLYRDINFVQMWDDHDFGVGNSDRTTPLRDQVAQVYRERFPSYDLPSSGGIYHAFKCARVQVIVLDTRYYRDPITDPAPRTLLGQAQKTWLENVLSTSTAETMFVVQSQRWNNTGTKTNIGSYPEERAELVSMFGDHGWLDKGRMAMMSGDVHGSGIASPAGNQFGGFPLYQGGSFDSTPAPYANGHDMDLGWVSARGQYLRFEVADPGRYIHVTGTVWRH
ncbi:MAG: alkaline phosphatase D family protein [Streptosporangiales bacterium]